MIIEFEGNKPSIDKKTFIADGSHIIGKVTIKEYSSIWFNTVVRGDVNFIEIGRYVNIQDNSVVHVSNDFSAIIGDYVTVGHNAIVHGCKIEDHCLIGMGSIIMDGALIGRGSIVAAGAVMNLILGLILVATVLSMEDLIGTNKILHFFLLIKLFTVSFLWITY